MLTFSLAALVVLSVTALPVRAAAQDARLPDDIAQPLGAAMSTLNSMCEIGVDAACDGVEVLDAKTERLRSLSASCARAYRSTCLELSTAGDELGALADQLARQHAQWRATTEIGTDDN